MKARNERGELPSQDDIERVLMGVFHKGDPLYFSLPCPDCGALMWIRCTPDGIEPVQPGEGTPRPHSEGAGASVQDED